MNHRRLYRVALFMWAAPLVAASVIMLGFLFLRSSFFVVSGMLLLGVGGLCLSAGLIAVMAILASRNSFRKYRVATTRSRRCGYWVYCFSTCRSRRPMWL